MGALKAALWGSQVCFLSFLRLPSVFQQLEQLREAVRPLVSLGSLRPGAFQGAGGEGLAGDNECPRGFGLVWLRRLNATSGSTEG